MWGNHTECALGSSGLATVQKYRVVLQAAPIPLPERSCFHFVPRMLAEIYVYYEAVKSRYWGYVHPLVIVLSMATARRLRPTTATASLCLAYNLCRL
jgi:hypothetical protein